LAATISWQEREKQKLKEQLIEFQELKDTEKKMEIPVIDKKISKIYFASRTQKQIEQVFLIFIDSIRWFKN
jgi:hypothetical protein